MSPLRCLTVRKNYIFNYLSIIDNMFPVESKEIETPTTHKQQIFPS